MTQRNDELLAAMEAMSTRPSEEARQSLHLAVAGAGLLVPLEQEPGEESGASVFVADADGGHPLFLAFTDEDALRAWARGPWPHVGLDGRTVCRFVAEHGADGLVLNAAGPWGGRLSRRDAELVAEGLVPESEDADGVLARGAAGSRLILRALRKAPPAELLAAIRDAAERAGVRSCFLAEGAFGAGNPHLVIGIVPGALAAADAARSIGEAAQPALGPGEPLDVLPLDDDLLATMRQLGRPVLDADADGA
jgi:SseB protein N-terminal domain/SseB protein C-terminal domain